MAEKNFPTDFSTISSVSDSTEFLADDGSNNTTVTGSQLTSYLNSKRTNVGASVINSPGTYDDYNIGNNSRIHVTTTGTVNITGIVAGSDGDIIYITSINNGDIDLRGENGSSLSNNRLDLGVSFLVSISGAILVYASNRWRLVGFS